MAAGRLTTINGPWADDAIDYDYDELGSVVSRSINGTANMTDVEFDALGRVTEITNALGQFDYAYVNASGRLATVTNPNDQTTVFDYVGNTGDQRLKQITHRICFLFSIILTMLSATSRPGSAAVRVLGIDVLNSVMMRPIN